VLPQIPAETLTPASPISQTLCAEGVKSAAYVPLIYGGQAIGFLGLQSFRSEKKWTDETITLLKLVADMLGRRATSAGRGIGPASKRGTLSHCG
jgi:GAF domain-containing protein